MTGGPCQQPEGASGARILPQPREPAVMLGGPPEWVGLQHPALGGGPCPKGGGSGDAACPCHCLPLGFAALGRASGLLHADSSGQSPREHPASGHWQRAQERRRRRRIWRAERWHLGAGGRSCSAPPARHRALKCSQERQEQPGTRARGFGVGAQGVGQDPAR